jgi:hypothetical protein
MWRFFLLALFWAEPALACSCDREIAHNILQFVPAAFVGKVIKVESIFATSTGPGAIDQATTFEISSVLRGSPPNPAVVYTHSSEAGCGYDFSKRLDQTLTVPVKIDEQGRMTTTYCQMIDINLPPRPRR